MADQGIQLLGQLAVQFRTLQLNAHNFHNLCAGPNFLEVHSLFAEVYGKSEGWYDDAIERLIGGGNTPDLIKVQQMAVQSLEKVGDTDGMLNSVLSQIDAITQAIEQVPDSGLSQGTQNALFAVADAVEVWKYKIGQLLS